MKQKLKTDMFSTLDFRRLRHDIYKDLGGLASTFSPCIFITTSFCFTKNR